MINVLIFLLTFIGMEFAANLMHRFVMHGFLWSLHEDHHNLTGKPYQKNDAFALFFAVPSFFSILWGSSLGGGHGWTAFGLGIMAYGIVYWTVHEVIIHRRWTFFRGRGWYFRALIRAHRDHHKVYGKEGCSNFGMLLVPWRYFAEEWEQMRHSRTLSH